MSFKTNIKYRKESLQKLLENLIKYESEIIEALHKDFKKPTFEAFVTETNYVVKDLKFIIKNIEKWAKPKSVLPSIMNFPSSDFIYKEPFGNVLIISPWNYPFQLALCPLIAAVAAGNKVTLKPSELTPYTASIISKIIRETFDLKHVLAITGDVVMAQELLKKRWDYIFFTGSVHVGKIIAKIAAENLTPVTLELGGKSPCIVDKTANIKLAAKRIIWGKMLNAGQTCVAPDYILIHESCKNEFIKNIQIEIQNALGENPEKSEDFARIINKKNWERQIQLLQNQNIILGGESNVDTFYIAPTLVDEPSLESQIMKEEIFGPILPIISFKYKNEVEKIILSFEKPLSLYLFSNDNEYINEIMNKIPFGGGCINDTIVHLANHRLPFGGVGHSGIGAYHGKLSFDIFSHQKSVVKKANWLDLTLRYAPYKKKFNLIKKILKII
jgi:aldehyde dehydrogenase (NAD+)